LPSIVAISQLISISFQQTEENPEILNGGFTLHGFPQKEPFKRLREILVDLTLKWEI